jgi:hypothetical protein
MTRLILKCPHTHAGKPYGAGDRIEVEADTADWLIDQGVAVPEPPSPKTDPEPKSLPRKEPKP